MKNQQKLKVLLNGTDVLNVLNGTDVLNVGNRQKCRLLALRRSRSRGILRIIGCEKRRYTDISVVNQRVERVEIVHF